MALADLKYVTTGTWGSGLARPLTAAEADGNVQTLRLAVQDLIDNPIEGVSISNITVSGREMLVYLSDSTTRGPFTLPIVYPRFRGEWAGATSYAVFDIFEATGYGTYLVALDHTSSAGSFNPNDGNSGGDYYVQIAGDPAATAPYVNISTTTLTLNATHAGKYLRFTNPSGCSVTLNAGVFTDNAEIHFRQAASGAVTVSEGTSAVTITAPTGFDTGSASLGAVFTLKHVTADEWDIFGKLAEISA